ncbi:MAG: hypothetical protein CMP21_01515 [Rickettsiales bacterium]|nr:hypothetical protein [Rickettsiales bacterium]|tara:strand:- start:15580 stop:16371 length:792 start_codon:yes stop_codon:yes gene_type:complete
MSDQNKDEFEHSDGLGDLLREREKLEFSWSKTIVILFSLFAVVIVGIYFIFNVGKSVIKTEIAEKIESKIVPVQEEKKKTQKSISKKQSSVKKSKIITSKRVNSTKNPAPTSKKLTPKKKSVSSSAKTKIIASTSSQKSKPGNAVKKTTPTIPSVKQVNSSKVAPSKKIVAPSKKIKTTNYTKNKYDQYSFKVITGTFSSKENASVQVKVLKDVGIEAFIKPTTTSLGSYFRVQAGAYKTKSGAQKQQAILKSFEIDSFIYTD